MSGVARLAAVAAALALVVLGTQGVRAQVTAGAAGRPAQAASGEAALAQGPWHFRVLLDGKPIGHHRFTLQGQGAERALRSEASFEVKLLGLTVYRYRHEATERWRGDCLAGLTARTDDDGEVSVVEAAADGGGLAVQGPRGHTTTPGCVMSFAYWKPALLDQARLLNAQTGEVEAVRVERLGAATVQAFGREVAAQRYRLTGPEQPIELWYSPQGDWLALSSTVSGGRTLRYLRE